MKVIRSKVLGFCMGVRRAIELASAEAQRARDSGAQVFTLGPLIHNPKVLADLENLGVKAIDEPPQNHQDPVVIRAHGISPRIESDLRERGCRVIDATCPNVKASQLIAGELAREGYSLFLVGEAKPSVEHHSSQAGGGSYHLHAEIAGIMGYAEVNSTPFCVVVSGAEEAGKEAEKLFKRKKDARTALIGQTTISAQEYLNIGEAIKKYFPNLEIIHTICTATADRQKALRELIDQVEAVVVAGGNESANTRRLLEIAQRIGKPSVLVEKPKDIPAEFYNYGTVGICAGASTPDSVIDEIELELLR